MSAKRTKGTREVPFTKAEYDKLVNDSSWTGGWVSRDNTTVYITCQGKVEQDVNGCALGSKENPFSEQAYCEMNSRDEFVGGCVQFLGVDEPSYRYPSGVSEPEGSGCGSASGCGCGSGCGSGCGCGSGRGRLTPGSEVIALPGGDCITVSWNDDGKVTVLGPNGEKISDVEGDGYDIMIQYGGFHIRYTIPEFYRVDCDGYDNKH